VVVSRPAWVLPVLTRTRSSRSGKILFRKLPSRQTSGRVRLPCLSWDTSTATVAPGPAGARSRRIGAGRLRGRSLGRRNGRRTGSSRREDW
jgi:hypothetical protein